MPGTGMLSMHFSEMLLCDLGRKGEAGVRMCLRASGDRGADEGERGVCAVGGCRGRSGSGRLLWPDRRRTSGPELGLSSQPASPGR